MVIKYHSLKIKEANQTYFTIGITINMEANRDEYSILITGKNIFDPVV